MPIDEAKMKSAIQRAAEALQAAANTISASLPPPVVIPPPPVVVPPPPPPVTTRQKPLAWIGTVDLDNMLSNKAGGITMRDVQAAGFVGVVVSLGDEPEPVPVWQESEWLSADGTGQLYISTYFAAAHDPLPTTQAQWDAKLRAQATVAQAAKRARAEGGGMDCEPYSIPDSAGNPWSADRALTRANAKRLGQIWREVGENFIVYPSSRASWPGSYNDLLYIQNGDTTGTSYGTNVFPDFIDGLIDGGLRPTIQDATFHIGVQLHIDGSWPAGIAHSVALTHQRFPRAYAAPMIWPDLDEGGRSFFTPAQVEGMVNAASKNSTGPFTIYNHQMTTGAQVAYWRSIFAAIRAGLA